IKQPREFGVDLNLAMSLVNLGIAVGSAVKTASILNVDNRVMFTIGVAAKKLNLIDADVVLGIPLSATSKNIYFDRVWPPK
ncbi:MAG: ferredoxin domain-containing protein, partial [Sulfolobales archaeon]